MIKLVLPTDDLFIELGKNSRSEEDDEVEASHGFSVEQAARQSYKNSVDGMAIIRDGILQGITGLVPVSYLEGIASPWLLTTNDVKSNPRALVVLTKVGIEHWHKDWPILENYIDARYEASLRWARWAGFTVFPAQLYGVEQQLFHKIRSEKWEQQQFPSQSPL